MQWKPLVCWLSFFTVMLLLPIGRVGAEPRYDVHGDRVHPGAEEFAGVFNGIGAAPEKDKEPRLALVNDRTYTVDKDAIFRTKSGAKTTLTSFKEGMAVRYYALDDLLTKMWVVEPDKGDAEDASKATEGGDTTEKAAKPAETIRLEDGAWKN